MHPTNPIISNPYTVWDGLGSEPASQLDTERVITKENVSDTGHHRRHDCTSDGASFGAPSGASSSGEK